MMQIHIDIRVLLLLVGFIFPGLVCADRTFESVPAGDETPVSSAPKQREIDRLQHDLASSRAEAEVINDENAVLHSRMKELNTRILELKQRVMDQSQVGDDPDTR